MVILFTSQCLCKNIRIQGQELSTRCTTVMACSSRRRARSANPVAERLGPTEPQGRQSRDRRRDATDPLGPSATRASRQADQLPPLHSPTPHPSSPASTWQSFNPGSLSLAHRECSALVLLSTTSHLLYPFLPLQLPARSRGCWPCRRAVLDYRCAPQLLLHFLSDGGCSHSIAHRETPSFFAIITCLLFVHRVASSLTSSFCSYLLTFAMSANSSRAIVPRYPLFHLAGSSMRSSKQLSTPVS